MDAEKAYQILRTYQLLNKEDTGIARVFEIEERYQHVQHLRTKIPRIDNILIACEAIEAELRERADQTLASRAHLGNTPFDKMFRKHLEETDRVVIAQVGQPLAPAPELDHHPAIEAIYQEHHVRTITEKCGALERRMGSKPGQIHVYARGDWRQPKWILKQFKLRALVYTYLLEKGFLEAHYG